jgi:hypothetical protein
LIFGEMEPQDKEAHRRRRLEQTAQRLGQAIPTPTHEQWTPDYTESRLLGIGVPLDRLEKAKQLFGDCPKSDCNASRGWKARVREWSRGLNSTSVPHSRLLLCWAFTLMGTVAGDGSSRWLVAKQFLLMELRRGIKYLCLCWGIGHTNKPKPFARHIDPVAGTTWLVS